MNLKPAPLPDNWDAAKGKEYSIHWWKGVSFSLFHPVLPPGIHNTHSFRPVFLGRIKREIEVPMKWQIHFFFLRATARERGKRGCHHPHSKCGVSFTLLCCAMLFHERSAYRGWWQSLGRGSDPPPREHFESLKLGPGGSWDWDSMCERKSGVAPDLKAFFFFFLTPDTHQNKTKENYQLFTIAHWAEESVDSVENSYIYCWLGLKIQQFYISLTLLHPSCNTVPSEQYGRLV